MKKSNFILTSVSLVLILAVACVKENLKSSNHKSSPNSSYQKTALTEACKPLSNEVIAQWHNEAVTYLYERYDFDKTLKPSNSNLGVSMANTGLNPVLYSDICDVLEDYLVVQKKLERACVVKTLSLLKAYINNHTDITSSLTRPNPEVFAGRIAPVIIDAGGSIALVNFLKEVYQRGNEPVENTVEYYRNYSTVGFNQVDLRLHDMFVRIANASYDLWITNTPQAVAKPKIACSTWVIINDGIGGVLGVPLGGIGSVILGTALSAGTNEDCIRRGAN